MRARVVVAALATAIGLGCSSNKTAGTGAGIAGTSSGVASAMAPKKESRQQDLITEREISSRAADATNALQIIQKLRPQMLRGRGMVSTHDTTGVSSVPRVYVDNVSFGGIESLSNLNASQIKEIRYMNARDATTEFGTGHASGVILVLTKR